MVLFWKIFSRWLWRSRYWLLIIVVVVTALWADDKFYGPGSEAYQRAEAEHAAPQSSLAVRPAGRSYELQYQSRNEKPEAAFLGRSAESWIALLTLVLAGSTIFLWLETRRLAEHAERDAREANRPMPVITITDPDSLWDGRGPVLDLRNVGGQPAWVSEFNVDAVILPKATPVPRPGRDHTERLESLVEGLTVVLANLNPEDEGRFCRAWSQKPFSEDDRKSVIAETHVAYAYGRLVYSDANSNEREIGFCYKHFVRTDKEPSRWRRVIDREANYDRAKKSNNP